MEYDILLSHDRRTLFCNEPSSVDTKDLTTKVKVQALITDESLKRKLLVLPVTHEVTGRRDQTM